jgi:transcriptional regulator with XRE-family HTH domain
MPLNMQDLAKRIVQARERLGWSQRVLSTEAAVGQNNLSALEAGKKPSVRADTLVRLAETLGCSLDYLAGRTDDPRPRRRRQAKADDGDTEEAA